MTILKHYLFSTFLSTYYVYGIILGVVVTKEKGTGSVFKEVHPG